MKAYLVKTKGTIQFPVKEVDVLKLTATSVWFKTSLGKKRMARRNESRVYFLDKQEALAFAKQFYRKKREDVAHKLGLIDTFLQDIAELESEIHDHN